MTVSVAELNRLLQTASYSRFIHTNLHLHTPATPWDWDGREGQTNLSETITTELYFDRLNKTSLDLVAITDHNCILWCESLITLAKDARKDGKSKLHILPGVELNTWEGPHLCAIFDEDIDIKKIVNMLIRLGYSGKGSEGEQPTEDAQISNIITEVDKLKGIIIAPHVHNKDGIWGNKEFSGRTSVLNDQSIKILAAPSGDIKKVDEDNGRVRLLHKNMNTKLISNSFGFINIADCHRLDDFELNTTWIKMTSPNLEGVRQVIFEPELRVSHVKKFSPKGYENPTSLHFCCPPEISHPHILALSVTGGMLDGLEVRFSPHLNTIIGFNYAGKSALLDCIRFVLNLLPNEEINLTDFCYRVQAFVGTGGNVTIFCRDAGQSIIGISRTCLTTKKKQGKVQFEGNPEPFSLIEGEFRRDSGVNIEQIFRPEVYAQGEVASIKKNIDQQMRIVNNLAKIDAELQEIYKTHTNGNLTIYGELSENAYSLVKHYQKSLELEEIIVDIEPLKKEIEELEALETSPLYSEKKQWSEVGVKIDANIDIMKTLFGKWSTSGLYIEHEDSEKVETGEKNDNHIIPSFDKNQSTPEDFVSQALHIFKGTTTELEASAKGNMTLIQASLDSLLALEEDRKKRESSVDDKIREEITSKELGAEGDTLITYLHERQKRLQKLMVKQQELQTIQQEMSKIKETRDTLLQKFKDICERVRSLRLNVVQIIDSRSLPNIKAELVYDSDKSWYRELLSDICNTLTDASNRIHNKDRQIDCITESVTPLELVELIRAGDPNQLRDKSLDITDNTARIIFNMSLEDQYKLETCLLEDSFIVSFQRYGDSNFTPINEGLSGGEQSLALISVAMIPKDIPLIIDQPEDELGPALITHDLVEQIRNVKPSRQLIFVTHVPNIPVLADSEQIIYILQKITPSGKHSDVECCGSLDNQIIVRHLLVLDGGDIAFQKRSQRYSPFLEKTL